MAMTTPIQVRKMQSNGAFEPFTTTRILWDARGAGVGGSCSKPSGDQPYDRSLVSTQTYNVPLSLSPQSLVIKCAGTLDRRAGRGTARISSCESACPGVDTKAEKW